MYKQKVQIHIHTSYIFSKILKINKFCWNFWKIYSQKLNIIAIVIMKKKRKTMKSNQTYVFQPQCDKQNKILFDFVKIFVIFFITWIVMNSL